MGQIVNLPNDILGTIMIMLVTSCNGATDLARLSATCSLFWNLAVEPFILKVVNFEKISTDDFGAHHHMNDFLCLCARAGNLAAESMIGKALMREDFWFWHMIMHYDRPLLAQNPSAKGLLQHPKLVRSFICHASGEVVGKMRIPFFCYLMTMLGGDLARDCGIIDAVTEHCLYELKRVNSNDSFAILGVPPPPSGPSHQEKLLEIFDEMFPLSLV